MRVCASPFTCMCGELVEKKYGDTTDEQSTMSRKNEHSRSREILFRASPGVRDDVDDEEVREDVRV